MQIPKITTFLMFNGDAEAAIKKYTSLFEDSEIVTMVKYDESVPEQAGKVQHAIFTLNNQVFMAIDNINGTPIEMTPATSLYVTVKDVFEMERLFNGLKDGGAILMPKTSMPPQYREFAWVQDKFGVNFQLALPEKQK
ncbi:MULTISPECIES: VOC family protein [unclassified Staphylococcus]|uniref:VOC family protein n=1 Tax=unclassified Staphylococcus TaxID=91994 RepID=UPI0021D3CE8F|nr:MULTISPECIES: VOC family protein [unclassified Staphylococcus]UXR77583.1 VOC family protein [Staphylococcus sp. IVB6227]UXR83275.1 VOC family protein [Staphylococcus sp. IVB6214]